MQTDEMWKVQDLEEYFKQHPEEEKEFIDEMDRLYSMSDETIDYPEDWKVYA